MSNITVKEVLDSSLIDKAEAALLLSRAWGCNKADLIIRSHDKIPVDVFSCYRDWLNRRILGEPVAYILKSKDFWDLSLLITPDVLIPRPETELIIEFVLERLGDRSILRLADLGTGSGAMALSFAKAKPSWSVLATDYSEAALEVARKNALSHGLSVEFLKGNWCEPLMGRQFDVIVTNPPYIAEDDEHLKQGDLRFEPRSALVSGRDGLSDIRVIIEDAASHLFKEGILLIEHGYQQGKQVRDIFEQTGYCHVKTLQDYSGLDRVTLGMKV